MRGPLETHALNQPSYVHGASPQPLIGQTIGALFDATCAAHADTTALISRHQSISWSYADLKTHVDAFAAGASVMGP